ncbi:hypothetical protein [Saccharospirillum salsuginis]|uniref:Uncharacterized protein n=1 Tax=Saccharospirillum salsuginis TaxID=418750 RepID=A0A918KGA9_9GAMM|nr:hypothetical protein [Saccharospirillum salsuginis]GGX62462.1 hypothetical protein GCM10007392_32950 [Saccharospirillum salsuginis]
MSDFIDFIKENARFVLAIIANVIALCVSIWWLIDSNWKSGSDLEIEPIVSTVALTATLLGLNFVNDKLSKPNLKVSMSMAMAQHPTKGLMHGISVTVENHSIIKAFVKYFQVEIPEKKQVMQFLYEGFTGQPLSKVIVEPGQSFSFNIVKENMSGAPTDKYEYGDFVVSTDLGYKFSIPAKVFREHFSTLMKCKT